MSFPRPPENASRLCFSPRSLRTGPTSKFLVDSLPRAERNGPGPAAAPVLVAEDAGECAREVVAHGLDRQKAQAQPRNVVLRVDDLPIGGFEPSPRKNHENRRFGKQFRILKRAKTSSKS